MPHLNMHNASEFATKGQRPKNQLYQTKYDPIQYRTEPKVPRLNNDNINYNSTKALNADVGNWMHRKPIVDAHSYAQLLITTHYLYKH